MSNKKIIIANWKMNPSSIIEAVNLVSQIKKGIESQKNKQTIVICPPVPYISEVSKIIPSKKKNCMFVGAQDCFYEDKGNFTGEVSCLMLKSLGIKYSIVGHYEKRFQNETHEIINKKIKILLKNGFTTVLCVGEMVKDDAGGYLKFIEEEIREGLKSVQRNYLKNIIVAYQPVSQIIGENKNLMLFNEIKEISLFIKKNLVEICGREIGLNIPIIYGGYFDKKNFQEFFVNAGIDGLLIEKDVLKADKFLEIIKLSDNLK